MKIPVLYPEDETSFVRMGYGPLRDMYDAEITETTDGEFEMNFSYPVGAPLSQQIQPGTQIISEPDNSGRRWQIFRVYSVEPDSDGAIEVHAEHVCYRLSDIPVLPFFAGTASAALTNMRDRAAVSCPFTFSSSVSGEGNLIIEEPTSIKNVLMDDDTSVKAEFGGVFEFDRYQVKHKARRGYDESASAVYRYGKNITSLRQEISIQGTITGILPFWKGTVTSTSDSGTSGGSSGTSHVKGSDYGYGNNTKAKQVGEDYGYPTVDNDGSSTTYSSRTSSSESKTITVMLPELIIQSQYAGRYPYPRIQAVDLSNDFDDQPTIAELRTAAEKYMTDNNIGIPDVSFDVDIDDDGQGVMLGDTVTVIFDSLGIRTTADVSSVTYDPMTKRITQISIGKTQEDVAAMLNRKPKPENAARINFSGSTKATEATVKNTLKSILKSGSKKVNMTSASDTVAVLSGTEMDALFGQENGICNNTNTVISLVAASGEVPIFGATWNNNAWNAKYQSSVSGTVTINYVVQYFGG